MTEYRFEHDLVRELGKGNWIDAVAGEAMVLGYASHDPILEAKGAKLAEMVRQTRYDSDDFAKVQGMAESLLKEVEELKKDNTRRVYIDKFPEGECHADDFRFEFTELGGRYKIEISVYDFMDMKVLESEKKKKAEEVIQKYIEDIRLSHCRMEEVVEEYGSTKQKFRYTNYYDAEGRLVRKIVIHDHQDSYSKGFTENYYFFEFGSAFGAWSELREVLKAPR